MIGKKRWMNRGIWLGRRCFAALLFALLFSAAACGGGTDEADASSPDVAAAEWAAEATVLPVDATAYVVQTLDGFHDRIYDECVWENFLYYICDGDEGPLLVRIDLTAPDDAAVFPLATPAGQRVQQIATDSDGNIHILAIQSDENHVLLDMFWHRFSGEEALLDTLPLPDAIGEGASDLLLDFAIDGDGNACLAMYFDWNRDEVYEIFVVSRAGEVLFRTPLLAFYFFFNDGAGNVYIHHAPVTYSMHHRVEFKVALIDLAAGALTEVADITAGWQDGSGMYMGMAVGQAGTLLLADSEGVFDFDLASGERIPRLSWAALGRRVYGASGRLYPLALPAGWLLHVASPAGGGDIGYARAISYSIVRPQTDEDVAVAAEQARQWEDMLADDRVGDISIGGVGWSLGGLGAAIDAFQLAYPHINVSTKQYGSIYGDDHSEGLLELNNDLIRGQEPDILLLHQDISYGAYATQGVFMDLNPFIATDEGFEMADFRENIIRAYEIGGALYGFPLSFYIDLLYGKEAEIGAMRQWNFDEFVAFSDRFPGSMIFHYPTKTDVLDILLRGGGGSVVDWGGEGTGFDRALVAKMLEYANRYIDKERYSQERMITERAADGDIHLLQGGANISTQFQMELLGGPISHIGYPSETGNGYLVTSANVVSINSKCQHTATAWEFITFLLSEEMQSGGQFYFPVRRDSIEPFIENARNLFGDFGGVGDGYELNYAMRGATDREIELFFDIIESASEIRVFDRQIDEIIKEEAGAYFAGQKGLDMVVDIIENRVGVYVKELK